MYIQFKANGTALQYFQQAVQLINNDLMKAQKYLYLNYTSEISPTYVRHLYEKISWLCR